MSQSPRTRVGVLGAGQLALMLAQAGKELDVDIICTGSRGDCAAQIAPLVEVDLSSAAEVAAFAAQVDLVTLESENIDAAVLHGLNLYPNADAVAIAQDRLQEKRFFQRCGIGVAQYESVDSMDELKDAMRKTGLPAILKTRRMGYDGKGQARILRAEDADAAWSEVGGVPCILEGMVRFDAEVSLLAARSRSGEIVFYPLVKNVHRTGILRRSDAPFARPDLQQQAERYLRDVLERLDYVGVLAVEFFVVGDTLLANEMAPRVHNSGHGTIEGAETSQFANHLRAILGRQLGGTTSRPTIMLNCIGVMPPESETSLFPQVTRHDYGKQPRPARKVGHLTLPASDIDALQHWEQRLAEIEKG